MKTAVTIFAVVLAAGIAHTVCAQPPNHFEVFQNIPDPFCNVPSGVTEIRYQLPMQSAVLLEVWNPDTTAVIRTLVYGVQSAGFYTILWDGADGGGTDLPDGAYPYSLAATDPDNGDSLFYEMLTATINCAVSTEPGTWGGIKAGVKKK